MIERTSALKKLKVIYEPTGQALEYSPLSTNPYKGCGNRCAYCYVPGVTHQPRDEFNAGAVQRRGYLGKLGDAVTRFRRLGFGDEDQVMFSFLTDLYHPSEDVNAVVYTETSRFILRLMSEHRVPFCVLTKGGRRALRDLDLYDPKLDAHAATLTSVDDAFSAKWEPGAEPASGRIAALRTFHECGISTWASLEPTLDVEHSLAVVRATHGFVDHYKIGRANYLKEITRTTDWRDYTLRMIDLLQRLGASHYFKKDLQAFLPPNYHNPLRVPQHH